MILLNLAHNHILNVYVDENQPQEKKYLDILKKYFGFAKFKP